MLNVENAHAYYGLSHILQGVTLDVREGEAVSILGRNGAGKTMQTGISQNLQPYFGISSYWKIKLK